MAPCTPPDSPSSTHAGCPHSLLQTHPSYFHQDSLVTPQGILVVFLSQVKRSTATKPTGLVICSLHARTHAHTQAFNGTSTRHPIGRHHIREGGRSSQKLFQPRPASETAQSWAPGAQELEPGQGGRAAKGQWGKESAAPAKRERGPGLTARPLLGVQIDDDVAQSGLQQNRHGARCSSATSRGCDRRSPSWSTPRVTLGATPFDVILPATPPPSRAARSARWLCPRGGVLMGPAPGAVLLKILVRPGRLARKPVARKDVCKGYCASFVSISRTRRTFQQPFLLCSSPPRGRQGRQLRLCSCGYYSGFPNRCLLVSLNRNL